jgi:hypothetical protein
MADVPDRDSVIAEGVLVASLVHVTVREAGFRASGIATTALRIHLADRPDQDLAGYSFGAQ